MQTRATENTEPTAATPAAVDTDSGAALLDTAREHDRDCHEKLVARFRLPLRWMDAGHHSAAALTRGSLSMVGRMLTALVLVLLVSLYVVNSPMETTYGLQYRQEFWSCLIAFFEEPPAPKANEVLKATPVLLASLLVGLALFFTTTAALGLVLREITRLGLRLLLRWAHLLGVEAAVPHP